MNSGHSQLKESTCPYCGVGCGIEVSVSANNGVKTLVALEGNKQHPANNGRLCIKGQSLLETTQIEGRLLTPQINGEQKTWDEASDWVANTITDTIAEYGKEAVAFYVSGQLLTEDYYIANKLMKGFIGSANIDTNSRLCMSSAVAAYKRAFGEDLVPCCYEDLEKTDLLILIGSNAAWTHPVLFQRIERAKRINPQFKIVQLDPRKTASSSIVDLHLPIKPGTDAAMFNGLFTYISKHAANKYYIDAYTDGFEQALETAKPYTPEHVAQLCDVALSDVLAFYELFIKADSALSFYSMGINQSTSGVDKANAIINCHLASGKIGKPGSGPFSITGQPNAMGGREVGGLANMLAAHMEIENARHRQLVSEFWQTNNIATKAGLTAVDLFDAIEQGKVKFVWIMGTNPVASMPNRTQIEAALAKCEAVVVSDVVESNDTIKFANVVLPATPWSEKDGTVTNSERCISRQRALQSPSGLAKHDWQIMCDIAKKMGFEDAFSFTNVSQIFKEHARLTAYQNNGERALNLAPLTNLSEQEYNSLLPVQWPLVEASSHQGQKRLFEDNQFFTHNKRAKFIPIIPREPSQITTAEYPYVLNTGRMRDQWHTMTRTGNATRLHQHTQTAYLYMHPLDAQQHDLHEEELVDLSSNTLEKREANFNQSRVILPVKFDSNLRRNSFFAPIHWTKEWASSATIAALFTSDKDPISGQPELKHAAINIKKLALTQQATLATKHALSKTMLNAISDYWTMSKQSACYTYRLALETQQSNWLDQFKHISGDLHVYYEHKPSTAHIHTCAAYKQDKLEWLVCIGQDSPNLNSDWLDSLFAAPADIKQLPSIIRFTPSTEFLQGKIVCSCHEVRELPIKQAIESGISSVDGLGDALKCGTNCGSCRGELAGLIDATTHKQIDASLEAASHNMTQPEQLSRDKTMFAGNTRIPINNLEVSKV